MKQTHSSSRLKPGGHKVNYLMPLWDLTPHMVLICMCVMYLCTHSTQLHATVKSQITVSLELPGGAAATKEVQKTRSERSQRSNSQDYATKEPRPRSLGAPAKLTDSGAEQGHITSSSPSHWEKSCVVVSVTFVLQKANAHSGRVFN